MDNRENEVHPLVNTYLIHNQHMTNVDLKKKVNSFETIAIMTHSLITHTPAVAVAPITTPPNEKISASQRHVLARRDVLLGGAVLGLSIINDRSAADAAARRPPPPPPTEKKDPNVSGVLAKVLASKKRKEAMKEEIAKLREKGKPINVPAAN